MLEIVLNFRTRERRTMAKYTLAAIRVNIGMSPEEMADALGITVDRWRRLESGETKMLAAELIKFHEVTGADYSVINLEPARSN